MITDKELIRNAVERVNNRIGGWIGADYRVEVNANEGSYSVGINGKWTLVGQPAETVLCYINGIEDIMDANNDLCGDL